MLLPRTQTALAMLNKCCSAKKFAALQANHFTSPHFIFTGVLCPDLQPGSRQGLIAWLSHIALASSFL